MPYQVEKALSEAMKVSEDAWGATLAKPKKAEDVTTYLWPWFVGLDGRTALEVSYNPSHVGVKIDYQALPEDNWPLSRMP